MQPVEGEFLFSYIRICLKHGYGCMSELSYSRLSSLAIVSNLRPGQLASQYIDYKAS